ncbi:hypothetical protein QBC47DRAFT_396226 [Echria macrotheca]|uniref:Uncharacterized protein n=1 Tax=Echria macrotheca TaxID=438768 RepID=A0AAJ0BLL5_9PEZI|nr:hypothetical protein QBC47DRAFT_396226 [Echria macrotheca]
METRPGAGGGTGRTTTSTSGGSNHSAAGCFSDEDAEQQQQQRPAGRSSPTGSARRGYRPVVTRATTQSWYTARTIVGAFSMMLSLALLGLGIKMSVRYDDAPLIHVSVAFVGFTAATSVAWQACEFIAKCARRDRRGIYPGTHVGVHICLCLACVATMGYVCFWVSQGDRWKYVEIHGEKTAYSPLYHIGIVVVIITSMLLLVHFILSILACQELRKRDDDTVVTVRYDGVGPDGTARPLSYHVPAETISLPAYSARGPAGRGSRPVSMTRRDGRASGDVASPRTEKSGDR